LNITFSETALGALQANLALTTTRHERKGQDCSVYSSQYLQIICTLGIIPVPLWLFMAYKTLYLGSRSVDLLVTGSRSPSYVLGREGEYHLFIVYTAASVHSRTTVFFVTITVLKTIQARPSNLLGLLRNSFMVPSSKLDFFCMCPCRIYTATSGKGLI